jgi:hypothetical protein
MARKKGGRQWTFSGIKAYFPRLPFDEWLKICRRGDHLRKDKMEVVLGVNWKKR